MLFFTIYNKYIYNDHYTSLESGATCETKWELFIIVVQILWPGARRRVSSRDIDYLSRELERNHLCDW